MERNSLQAEGSSTIQDICPFHDAYSSITLSLNVPMPAATPSHKCLVYSFQPRFSNIHFDFFYVHTVPIDYLKTQFVPHSKHFSSRL